MAYYDRIARRWHDATGYHGGAFKQLVLNEWLLDRLGDLAGRAVLELGAGNGYFLPLALRRQSGRLPARLIVTDASAANLTIAQRHFRLADAEYLVLDVADPFPCADGSVDLVLATMVFQEVPDAVLRHALAECARLLSDGARLLATVLHPAFVHSLRRRERLRRDGRLTLMPSADGLWLPVCQRELATYEALLAEAGFTWQAEELAATEAVLRAKPGLREAGPVPIALVLDATRSTA